MKSGVSRYFDNTDFDNFRCEETIGGVRFCDGTQHDRKLKVVAIVESNGDYLDFTCELCCGNGGTCSDILYPLAMNPYREIRGKSLPIPHLTGEVRLNPAQEMHNPQTTMMRTKDTQVHRACNSTLTTITMVALPCIFQIRSVLLSACPFIVTGNRTQHDGACYANLMKHRALCLSRSMRFEWRRVGMSGMMPQHIYARW